MIDFHTQIIPEDGDYQTSLKNLLRLTQVHGSPVGAIHRINPSGDQSSLFFFNNGFSHECTGFSVYLPKDDMPLEPLMALKTAFQIIPGLANRIEQNEIIFLILTDETKQSLKDGKTIYVVFRAPQIPGFEEIQDSIGCQVMDSFIEQSYTDNNCEIFQVE